MITPDKRYSTKADLPSHEKLETLTTERADEDT